LGAGKLSRREKVLNRVEEEATKAKKKTPSGIGETTIGRKRRLSATRRKKKKEPNAESRCPLTAHGHTRKGTEKGGRPLDLQKREGGN